MTEPDSVPLSTRTTLLATPEAVTDRLTGMGRVMIITSINAVTFERIGPVEHVSRDGARLHVAGASHDSSFELARVQEIVVLRRANASGKVFPRIDFNTEAGEALFSVVGMEGLEPFDASLAGLPTGPSGPAPEGEGFASRPEASTEDPACAPLDTARGAGVPVSISIERPGFRQAWTGVVPELKLSMGFVNVMVPDFHMHVAGGAVHGWTEERAGDGMVLRATGADGRPLGLSITAPSALGH